MFDGNFRSKREVNLGSRGNRRRNQQKRSSNKQDLLRNAQELRKQRQQQQNREKAVRLIQRVARGWKARLWCLEYLLSREEVVAVSICLSLRKLLPSHSSSILQVLLRFSNNDSCPSVRRDNSANLEDKADSEWFSQERIVRFTLQCFTPILDSAECQALFSILENYMPILSIRNELFVDLVMCFKSWWHQPSSDESITATLFSWANKAREGLFETHSDALLGSVLLSARNDRVETLENAYSKWFLPLAASFDEDDKQSDDVILRATLKNLNGMEEEQNTLSNTLNFVTQSRDFIDPLPLVKFMSHMLTKESTSPLIVISSLLIRGDSLDFSVVPVPIESVYEESDHEEEADDVSKPDVKRQRPTSRYAKKDLLTVPKLDKLYQDRIEQLKNQCKADDGTKALALKVIDAPWLEWGLQLLEEATKSEAYVKLLALLLQASSSMRPTMKLGVFSKLSFSKRFMELLWRVVTLSSEYTPLIVFCELFSHYLVALSDLEFVRLHADDENAQALQARDIVNHLKNVLFDVYWSKPVLASEICPSNPNARILLSGTKVWNSLYERWNRLVRSPFCDESMWWFPHLASKDGDRAILPAREQQQEENQDDDSMNEENDSVDENSAEMRISEPDSLADSFSDPKMARVLTCIPQAIPFDRRVRLFSSLLKADKLLVSQQASHLQALMAMQGGEQNVWMDGTVREKVKIKRAELYSDSMSQLNALGKKLKHQVQVTFINQHGAEEAGIDGGGVFKEFLDDLIKDAFAARVEKSDSATPALFTVTPHQTLAVNMDVTENKEMLAHYEFLGRVLGKAVYESILVEPQFCLPFLNQLLAKQNSTEDLKNLDEEFYKNLIKLRTLGDQEIEALGLTFEMTIGSASAPRTIDLIPGGGTKAVNSRNVFKFIHLIAHHRLNILGSIQTRAFLRGFRDLIPASWVRLFSASELQKLISGDDSIHGISVGSLKQAMQYGGGYHPSQPFIQDFWSILEDEFTPEQQRKFLKFMTSCSRQPLLGFGSLEPAPAIQQIRLTDEEITENAKLPTSQTCFNLLKLPNYKNRDLLKKKLIDAIESGAGFELT
ncbi:unnamed protein product [Cylindrotheca closterium]|uniref:HECT-type E3 ubiquitin transferase n=1 Tax=Cylindrotheca closterium TaxID=2856 RepID=A0AAD2CTY2_9STRA|nr:unnamed protein product [Cylindrotheca closterium]